MNWIAAALTSVAMWSCLGFLTVTVLRLPPFFILSVAFFVAAFISLPWIGQWRLRWYQLLLGVYGILGFHVLYVVAMSAAPPVEANLIVEAWPLLIVLITPLLFPDMTLRLHHLLGSCLAFTGAAIIIGHDGVTGISLENSVRYLPAAAAALVWASYSVLSKKLGAVNTGAIGCYCLVSAVASGLLHMQFETFVMPSPIEWLSLMLLGIGPLGGAFFTWDIAMRQGDPRIVGALSYLIPLGATLLLVTLGGQPLHFSTGLAMVMIAAGTIIGSRDLLRKTKMDTSREKPSLDT